MNSRISFISRAGVALAGALLLAACGGDDDKVQVPQFVVVSDADAGAAARPQVTMTITNGEGVTGNLVITLVPEHAPQTVTNFLNYVNAGFYDGTIFHRKAAGFVLQAGGYEGPVGLNDLPAHKPTNPPIPLEVKVSNVQGTVAMARTSALNSATSEFFINLANNTFLNTQGGGYAAFGYITEMTLVGAMANAPCVQSNLVSGSLGCLPLPNLTITSAVQTR